MGQDIAQLPIRESSVSSASSTSSWTGFENQAPFEYLSVPAGSRAATSPLRSPDNRTPDLERSTLVAIIAPNTYQSQLLSSFIVSIGSASSGKLAPAFHCHSVWMSEIAARPEISSTLTWAIRAISLSHLGLQMQDRNIIQNSRTMYGKALLQLNKSLQDPVEGLTSDTLSATILLSFYEFMTCTEKHSWVRHAGGAGNLIRIRGPDRHRSGFDRSVFLSCRYTILMEAFQTRRPCFLALPEWKRLSRELQETSDDQTPFSAIREDIYQDVVDIPGFVADAVNYMSDGSRDTTELRELTRRGHNHRSRRKKLHARLNDALKDVGLEPTMTASASNDKLFPVVYQYPGGNLVGSHYCAFWSLNIMLNIVLIGLEAKLSELSSPELSNQYHQADVDTSAPPPREAGRSLPLLWMLTERTRRAASPSTTVGSPSDFPTMSEDDTTRRRELYMSENISQSREICKSVESISTSAFLGPMFLVYGLRNALRVLSDEREKEWIMKKMYAISKTFGIAKTEVEIYKQMEVHT